MTLALTRAADTLALLATNTVIGAFTGSTFIFSSTAAGYVASYKGAAVPGQILASGSVNVTVPATYAGSTYWCLWSYRDAANVILSVSAAGPSVTIATGGTATLQCPTDQVVPAGAVAVGLIVYCDAGLATRRLTINSVQGVTAAYPDDITAAGVSRDLARTADVARTSGKTYLNQGTIGAQAGTLTYLVSTWAQLQALEAVYLQPSAVAITGAEAGALAGYTHYGLGTFRATAEKPVPGRLSRWLVQLDTRAV